jgi:hypothetical protein
MTNGVHLSFVSLSALALGLLRRPRPNSGQPAETQLVKIPEHVGARAGEDTRAPSTRIFLTPTQNFFGEERPITFLVLLLQ